MGILIPAQAREAMLRHALSCLPEEACGLIAGDGEGAIRMVYPLTNAQRSRVAFTIDPVEHFRALQHADRNGWELIGAFHSHPTSEPYPSPTDIAQAAEPDWLHIVIGLRPEPELRMFRIRDGRVTEVE
ncbi:MAG: M67 family metallopeptidase [Acidimicrobiia bacterium]